MIGRRIASAALSITEAVREHRDLFAIVTADAAITFAAAALAATIPVPASDAVAAADAVADAVAVADADAVAVAAAVAVADADAVAVAAAVTVAAAAAAAVAVAAADAVAAAATAAAADAVTAADADAVTAAAAPAITIHSAIARHPLAVIATPSVDTLLRIYTALDSNRPIALLHPRLPPHELTRQRAAITAASLPDDAGIILFTSGSTGPPRGIVHTHASLLAAADASAQHLGWRDDDRWLLCLPLAHAGGLSIVIRCLVARRPLVLLEGAFDPRRVAALLRQATIASLVPTQLAALLDDPSWTPPPRLRAVLLGGAAAPPALLAAARVRGVPIRTTYGLTETLGQIATACSSSTEPVLLPTVEVEAGTRETPAPIRIRGPMLAACYLDGAPIAPELVTADLGFICDDGSLRVIGRADDVIVTGGESVHPREVEAVLSATSGVRAAYAFGVADARWGQIVGAAIATDATFDRSSALAQWYAALPAHARPRRLVTVARLPQLASGKLDRRAIAALPTVAVDYG